MIEKWLAENVSTGLRHAFGYNAEETSRVANSEYAFAARMAFGFRADEASRVARATEYDSFRRLAFYPLVEWGWTREDCLKYLERIFGIEWKKSACVYCPFNRLQGEAIERHRNHASQVGDALLMEHVALALNPRAGVYKNHSLIQITQEAANAVALETYRRGLGSHQWAIYRVRRIYTAKGKADRAVERLRVFADEVSANRALTEMAANEHSKLCHAGAIAYLWREERTEGRYPCHEEFLTAAPATVQTKARYGLPWFEARWTALQLKLF